MSTNTTSTASATASFPLGTVLFVVFLVLKLTGVIDWSWWWITAPLWIPVAFVVGIFLLFAIIAIAVGGRR